MAIDSANKRRGNSGLYYVPDGAINTIAKRTALAGLYYTDTAPVPSTDFGLLDVLFEGIMDLYEADSTLMSAITSLEQDEAQQYTRLPYATFTVTDAMPDRMLAGHNENLTVQFNVFTKKRSERADAWSALDAVYDKASITVDGYTVISFLWDSMYMVDSRLEDVWQLIVRYKVHMTLN